MVSSDDSAENHARELGVRLRESREFLQLTQADVAQALGVQRTAVHAMEMGTRKVSATELQGLARLYRRPVTWLLGEDEPATDDEVQTLYRVARGLTDADRAQVLDFARFLAGRPHAGRGES
jgi:transcriptional regulator with XRE-family HTH domain